MDHTRICKSCDEAFTPSSRHRSCPKCRASARKRVACRGCKARVIRRDQKNKLCKTCSAAGPNNNAWKGGKTYHKAGYVMVRVPGHPRARKRVPYVFEHILVMEEHLGRLLVEGENVHHKNGVRADNRIENLELWQGPQPSGARVSDLVEWATELLQRHAPERLA